MPCCLSTYMYYHLSFVAALMDIEPPLTTMSLITVNQNSRAHPSSRRFFPACSPYYNSHSILYHIAFSEKC